MCRSNADPLPLGVRTPSAPLGRLDRSPQKHRGKPYRYNQKRTFHEPKCVALDCEFVGVGPSKVSVLARVTVVDIDGNTVFDTFVKVDEKITDYRTNVSGITSKDLEGDVMSYGEARANVKQFLSGNILVGHALQNDLQVLRLHHPFHMTRDTAQYVPFMREVGATGMFRPRRLRDLVWEYFGEVIQAGSHCSAEDSLAAMSLYKLVKDDWEKCFRLESSFSLTPAIAQANMAQQKAYYGHEQANRYCGIHQLHGVGTWQGFPY